MRGNTNRDESTSERRRRLLKLAGVGITGGFAGCTGDGGDGGGGGGGDGSGGDATETTAGGDDGTVAGGQATADLEGTTVTYWSTIGQQSATAEKNVKQIVSNFEESTGATVELNISPNPAQQTQTWVSAFQSDEWPVLFDVGKVPSNFLMQEEWIVPFDEWRNEIDDETISAIEWIFDPLKKAFSGTDWAEIAFLPFATRGFSPLVARRDHFEQAGLSPKDDFPPESEDEFVEIGKQLKADGPAQYPVYLAGHKGDFLDHGLPPWTVSRGGPFKGRMLNKTVTESNFLNEHWKGAFKRYHSIHRDMELSGPWTPTAPDEDVPQKMAAGQISIATAEILTLPPWKRQAPELVEDGTIMWGPHWSGPGGERAVINAFFLGISKKPPAVDEETWSTRQDAAIELMKTFLSKEFQRQIPEVLGLIPVRQDVWSEVENNYRDDHIVPASMTNIRESSGMFAQHPKFVSVFLENAAFLQEAMKGNSSPEKALEKAHEHTQDILEG